MKRTESPASSNEAAGKNVMIRMTKERREFQSLSAYSARTGNHNNKFPLVADASAERLGRIEEAHTYIKSAERSIKFHALPQRKRGCFCTSCVYVAAARATPSTRRSENERVVESLVVPRSNFLTFWSTTVGSYYILLLLYDGNSLGPRERERDGHAVNCGGKRKN